jgi:protein-S-isoprenylcysteine O-methyltransferase Ste14
MWVRWVAQIAVWLAIMGALLFAGAGTLDYAQGWAFIGIYAAGSVVFCAWLARRDPALLASRLGSLAQKDQPVWDKLFMGAAVIGWNVWLLAMAADARRWQASHVPAWLEATGGLLIVIGFLAVVPVFAANSFAAPVVKVQTERKQRVIDTGPYALVRHPMYAAAMLYLVGVPLLLGSWYGLIGTLVIALGIAWRATREERVLACELSGYADYMTRVRWRLVPYVW